MSVEQTIVEQTTVDDAAALAALEQTGEEGSEETTPDLSLVPGTGEGEGEGAGDGEQVIPDEVVIPEAGLEPFEFGGVTIDPNLLEVPEEFAVGLEAQGLNGAAVAMEIYSEEGLSDDTKAKLYAEFGQTTVDLYVRSQLIEARAMIDEYVSEQTEHEAASVSINEAVAKELEGGVDFPTLARWVADTVTPEERADLNADLASGRQSTVLRAIKELKARYTEANGQGKQTLLEGSGDTGVSDTSPLSAEQYQKVIASGDYYKNAKAYDSRRVAGQALGI